MSLAGEGLNQNFGFVVHDLARLMRKRFEQLARMRQLGFTRAQAAVIFNLARNEGTNQVSLAQQMELEPITLVRLLDKLEAIGLGERRPDPLDRRARNLFLSATAWPLLERIKGLIEEVQQEALAGFGADQHKVLVGMLVGMKSNLLERLADNVDEAAQPAPAVAHG